ncbi:indole-3-glycerol phosphate synthase-domain-containing protein [Phlyctochytrium arcticum]|nr:indole-3-glycerol phosphate synthase-domain-containing protein [Phlyctochytrium arcticum]
MTTLLIDNYDSFTWNVYQYLSDLGAQVEVFRNDQISLEDCIALNPRNIVISPGPGRPADAGVSNDVIRHFAGKVPILGVCLGEQCMYEVYGGTVTYAGEIVHGKTSPVKHDSRGLYEGVPQNFEATRYHSLAGDPKTLPECLEVTSWIENGIIMGVRHKNFVMEGVQYHPESIASECGKEMFANFLRWEGGTWDKLVLRPDLVKAPEGHGSLGVAQTDSSKRPGTGDGIPLSKISKMNSTATPSGVGGNNTGGGSTSSSEGAGMLKQIAATSKGPSILETIDIQRKKDVQEARAKPGQSAYHLARSVALGLAPPPIDFASRILSGTNSVAVMAEIKRASPSKKDIDISAHAPTQALAYAHGGAAVISVLTEPKWFKGCLDDMRLARAAVDKIPNRPAILRKDFIVDRSQVLEARLYGADTLLLIVAILSDETLKDLLAFSRELGMEPMVEVANEAEMKRAVQVGSKVIGVNNRDLHTFSMDMTRTSKLASMVTEDIILVALSGITGRADVETYIKGGARAVLVGEALMRSPNKRAFIQSLLGNTEMEAKDTSVKVKICGVTNVEDALVAAAAGADFIGLIFAPSPRQISESTACEIITAVHQKYGTSPKVTLPIPANGTTSTDWLKNVQSVFEDSGSGPRFVGVFSNQRIVDIQRILTQVPLDLVQFHGDESASLASLISVPVIKAYHVLPGDTAAAVTARIHAPDAVGCVALPLLDTGIKGTAQQGGSGQTFDWNVAVEVQKQGGAPVILAGGLTDDNVSEAVRQVRPWCVDVSSGTEAEGRKGHKDHEKVRRFVHAAKNVLGK